MSLLLAGLSILVLGESHMSFDGQLISTLPDELEKQGAQVYSYGVCGASAGDWLIKKPAPCSAFRVGTGAVRTRPADISATQPIGDLIKKHQPDLIVLVIGDTMASYDSKVLPKSWVWQNTSALTTEINKYGTRCVWVGPPWGQDGGVYHKTNARVREFSDYLYTLVSPCTYVNSLNFSREGEWKTIDGQHLDRAGYEGWARGITQSITAPSVLATLKKH